MSLMIYCCYHNADIEMFANHGWLNPDWSHVTYVKTVPGPYTFKCRQHLDAHAQPWFKPRGTKWQEWEFIASLAWTQPINDDGMIGFAHYDMNLSRLMDIARSGKFYDPDCLTVMTSYTVEWAMKQGITVNGKEVIDALLGRLGMIYHRRLGMQLLPLCSAAIMRWESFRRAMVPVVAAMDDMTSLLHAPGPNERFAGSVAERMFALRLLQQDLPVLHCPVEHMLVQSDRVDLCKSLG